MERTAMNADIILEASRFQNAAHINLSTLVLTVHDWLILFYLEIEYVWRAKWSGGKILYVISRYGPFVDISIQMIMQIPAPGTVDHDTCLTLFKIASWSMVLGVCTSEAIILLRTSAIYSGSKPVTTSLSIVYTIIFVAGIIVNWHDNQVVDLGPPPGNLLTACNIVRKDAVVFCNFLLLLAFEFVVVVLTVRMGLLDIFSGTPLLRVVYRDSISFFLALFGLSFSAIFVVALGPPQYGGVIVCFVRAIHGIISCRILLNLKRTTRPPASSLPVISTDLVFVASSGVQTNLSEMAQPGTYDVEGRGEDNGGSGTARDRRNSIEEVK